MSWAAQVCAHCNVFSDPDNCAWLLLAGVKSRRLSHTETRPRRSALYETNVRPLLIDHSQVQGLLSTGCTADRVYCQQP